MTHPQIAWTIYALWLGAAVVYVSGHRVDFIKKHPRIWWFCAIPMVAPVFLLAIGALFFKGPFDLMFKRSGVEPNDANARTTAPVRSQTWAARQP